MHSRVAFNVCRNILINTPIIRRRLADRISPTFHPIVSFSKIRVKISATNFVRNFPKRKKKKREKVYTKFFSRFFISPKFSPPNKTDNKAISSDGQLPIDRSINARVSGGKKRGDKFVRNSAISRDNRMHSERNFC